MKREEFFAGIALGALISKSEDPEADMSGICDLADTFALELQGIMKKRHTEWRSEDLEFLDEKD